MPIDKETLEKFNYNKIFIETGTSNGSGLQEAYDAGFEKLISIEFYPEKYANCVKRFKGKDNVTLLCGDSGELLCEALEDVVERVTFWLDSHYSGSGKYHTKPLADTCPILRELECIKNHNVVNHTILIDDIRIFRKPIALWNNISEAHIINKLKEINHNYNLYYVDGVSTKEVFKNDVLVAEIK
jgi:hypothetical protein